MHKLIGITLYVGVGLVPTRVNQRATTRDRPYSCLAICEHLINELRLKLMALCVSAFAHPALETC